MILIPLRNLTRVTDGHGSVIAVQGLGAHPYYTWVGKQPVDQARSRTSSHRKPFDFLRRRRNNAQAGVLSDTAQPATDAAETMWLRDLLPGLIPHARIATYSYESDWRKAGVKTSLRQCGEQFLNVLHQHRSSENVSTAVTVLNTFSFLMRISVGVSATAGVYWA